MRFSVEDEAYALADYPLTAAIMERGGGFAIDAEDESADARERALLTEWGFTAVTPPRRSRRTARRGWSSCSPTAAPRAPGRAAGAAAALRRGRRPRPAPGYAADVTSRANVSNTST